MRWMKGIGVENLSSKKIRTNRATGMVTSCQKGEFQGKGRRTCWNVSDQP